jgi:hypothetical protein
VGFSARLTLDEGTAGLVETLISGIGGGGEMKAFLGRSSTVLIVGTAGEVTALDSGRGPEVAWLKGRTADSLAP